MATNQSIEIQGLRFRAVDNGDGTFSIAVNGGSGGGGVTSFNSRTGAVVPASNDYSFAQLSGSASVGQIPSAIPISSVGSAGLSGTSPITISAAGAIGCATCVTASAPGAGIAHFAGGTQAVTSSAVNLAGSDVTGQLPIGAVGSGGLSGTSPITISSAGVIACATCNTSAAAITSNALAKGSGGGQGLASSTVTDGGAGVQIGSPTGGAQGAGTLNATGLFVNGVAPALLSLAPKTSTTDTLNNATLTTEQFFATSITIPASTIAAQTALRFRMIADITGTGTPATATLRARLCTTGLPTPSGCVIAFQSSAVAPGVATRDGYIDVDVIGTAAPGASVSVIATGGNGQAVNVFGADIKGSSIVGAVATSSQLFLVFSVQYGATTTSSSMTLTAVIPQPIIH